MRADAVAAYRNKLLEILKREEVALSVSELLTLMGSKNRARLNTELNFLAGDRKIIKLPGRGASFTYKYLSSVDRNPIETREIAPVGFAQLLRSLATNKWVPKTTKSSAAVPFAVAKLYHFAHDIAMGGKREQSDYDDVKIELRQYYNDLLASIATVKGILDKPELWSAKDSAKWLLSAGGSSSDYDSLANEVEEKQR